jgi:hypothetical protein
LIEECSDVTKYTSIMVSYFLGDLLFSSYWSLTRSMFFLFYSYTIWVVDVIKNNSGRIFLGCICYLSSGQTHFDKIVRHARKYVKWEK